MPDIGKELQKEVARINDMISTTKALLPNGNVNFAICEMVIERAEEAIREQDVIAMVRLLPQLKKID